MTARTRLRDDVLRAFLEAFGVRAGKDKII